MSAVAADREAPAGRCPFCTEPTRERDRSGRLGHGACVAAVIATVARESRPVTNPADLAALLAEQRQPSDVDEP